MFKRIIRFLKKLFHLNDSVYYINGSENLLPPLSKEEEEKAKNPPKEDVTEDDSKKRRLKDKIKKQKRGEKNGTV